jgi:uncharacterized protein
MHASRRQFLKTAAAASLGFSGLQGCISGGGLGGRSAQAKGYGPLEADPDEILDLPKGFSYQVISTKGDRMDDGFHVPGSPDGMAAFAGPDGLTTVVRNHEINPGAAADTGPFGKNNELLGKTTDSQRYDPGVTGIPCLGGTSTFVYDTRAKRLESQFLSLAGTLRNCAGGPTPWNSWITCEETVELPGPNCVRRHGYAFDVPARSDGGLADPIPLIGMGRFNHEAVAVDPASGVVYETEDRPDSCIYRFIPNEPGKLAKGGRLQALAIEGVSAPGVDTRNWTENTWSQGETRKVRWIDLDDVDSETDTLRFRAFGDGAARFARGEGMWQGRGAIFFACTSGGQNKKGQIWRYVPSPREGAPDEKSQPGTLELFLEPNDGELVDNADNLTVAPWGDLVICEDGKGDQFLVGVTPRGGIYKLGHNRYNTSEFAGAAFSPDGRVLFVNIQKTGLTLSITGPWKKDLAS